MLERAKYDFLIIGAGVSGAVFAREMTDKGYKCIVIDKRDHIGGQCYCDKLSGVVVHKYGAHIFNTNSDKAWDYFTKYTPDVRRLGIYTVQALAGGVIYPLPFNMNTFAKLWADVRTPEEARRRIAEQTRNTGDGDSLQDAALSQVGEEIFEKLIRGYTEKQWGTTCDKLPKSIIGRIPVRFTYDNNYYNCDKIGIPRHGYNDFFRNLLRGIDVVLNCDITKHKELIEYADKVFCTAPIDEFFGNCFGRLDYRSLYFEYEVQGKEESQGCPVVNYCDKNIDYTRRIEHNQFTDEDKGEKIVVSYEYPQAYGEGAEPYYPVPSDENRQKYQRYIDESRRIYGDKITWGGRLGGYKYISMDEAILGALCLEQDWRMNGKMPFK